MTPELHMTPELKAKWTAALRSGKYKQGDNFLRFGDKYCCLGVLADVAGATWLDNGEWGMVPLIDDIAVNNPRTELLSEVFRLSCGLSDVEQRLLADMNDEHETFADIADHIEASL